MKKFFIGLLSVFLLIGAGILSACGSNKVTLSLSSDYVSIRRYSGAEEGDIAQVTATVSGGSSSISLINNSQDKFSYSTSTLSGGRTLITITGKSEGNGTLIVRTAEGNQSKTINVEVYSEVSAMSAKQEEQTPYKNFAVRGATTQLDENALITFSPSENSRRTITWTFADGLLQTSGASIEGTNLIIDEDYAQDTIVVYPTTEKGVTIESGITLPVIEKIESALSLSYSYSKSTDFTAITEAVNLNIVPNFAEDEQSTLYIKVNYIGNLSISHSVVDSQGQDAQDKVLITQDGYDTEGYPIYQVVINDDYKDKDINENFVITFNIGYQQYDYSISTADTPITLVARERVNNIRLTNGDGEEITNGQSQVYYSEYSNHYGEYYTVDILPTTVQALNNGYNISVEYTSAVTDIIDGDLSPITMYYYDNVNDATREIRLVKNDNGVFVTETPVSYSQIYIKANSNLLSSADGVVDITFTSQENPLVSKTIKANLIKAVAEEDFVFEDADFSVNSSQRNDGGQINIEKEFTLNGQTTIEGLLDVVTDSSNVTLRLEQVSNTNNSVTFKLILTLLPSSYGITSTDHYYFVNANGLQSETFTIDIFLPLEFANITFNNSSDSVSSYKTSNVYYDSTFSAITGDSTYNSTSYLMLKNGSTTPINYRYNSSNGNQAVASIDVKFFDYMTNDYSYEVEDFKNLLNSQDGLQTIFNGLTSVSSYAYFASDNNSITTKNVGYTYAVVSFTGKGSGDNVDENGMVTFYRIILIESYIYPGGFSTDNRNVNLYARNTVATSDQKSTTTTVNIDFNNINITYDDLSNFSFVSTRKDSNGNSIMGDMSLNEENRSITWENGRYTIENIVITSTGISFNIIALNTMGQGSFSDELEVHYRLAVDTDQGIINRDCFWTTISISIVDAQRVESVSWDNASDDGVYFEVGSDEIQYLTFKTTPTNARNNSLMYVITDEDNNASTLLLNVDSEIREDAVGLSLNHNITEGINGYIYVLPQDASYDNVITFYYKSNSVEYSGTVSVYDLSKTCSISAFAGMSWYEFLTGHAYFKSHTTGDVYDEIAFADILLRIDFTVADGRDFDHAYRIYDENGFNNIDPDTYYTVMNNIELTSERKPISIFNGGLQGNSEDITIIYNNDNLIANNFAVTLNGTIRNITFTGNVTGYGFVVDTVNESGLIENVTVDVNELYPSTLSTQADTGVGGIAGTNNGTIRDSSVLGLNITASGNASYVGGIAGINAGTIYGSSVEFYNLNSIDETGTKANAFSGGFVGGIAGQIVPSTTSTTPSIENSYVYNYTNQTTLHSGSGVGAIIGNISTGSDVRIYKSFAVVYAPSGNMQAIGNSQGTVNSQSDYYIATKSNSSYGVMYYYGTNLSTGETTGTSTNLVREGDDQFQSYVNSGYPHYPDVYQEPSVTTVNYPIQTYTDLNGYYRSLAVNENKGILFYYSIDAMDLTESEQRDLDALNTITLAELVGEESISRNVIISSSNNRVIDVKNNELIIRATGDANITLSSKQDVTLSKTIAVKVLYGLSPMIVSWIDNAGNTNVVTNNSIINIQKTKSINFDFNFEKTYLTLGAGATVYDFTQNDLTIAYKAAKVDEDATEGNVVSISSTASAMSYQAITDMNSVDTSVEFMPSVTAISGVSDSDYNRAVTEAFKKNFTISPSDGVITFSVSEEGVPITPSTTATLQVQIETTAQNDYQGFYPKITYNGRELVRKVSINESGENALGQLYYSATYNYSIDRDSEPILTAFVNLSSVKENEMSYTYQFEITFAVADGYKSQVDQDMDFVVSFASASGSDSQYQNNGSSTFELHLTRQQFTNIDVSNYSIASSQWWRDNNGNYYLQHTRDKLVGVVAPGSSSILQISINPEFAYYDYMELSYSNASVSNALSFQLLRPKSDFVDGSDSNQFIEVDSENIQYIGDRVIYRPTDEEKLNGAIYFKVYVNSDNIINLTASFFNSEGGEPISQVTSYLSISYLAEAQVTIDGENTAYVAKGSSAKIQVQVRKDQELDSLTLSADLAMQGVSISDISTPSPDPITGIKTYTATLTLQINATATDNIITVQAQVSREINDTEEVKLTYAYARIVEFKVDGENAVISDADTENNLTVWLNVPKAFSVTYNLYPESYNYDTSDPESVETVNKLNEARQAFLDSQLYHNAPPANGQEDLSVINNTYAINYTINDEGNSLVAEPLSNRIVYVTQNGYSPVNDAGDGSSLSFSFDNENNSVSISGNRIVTGVQLAIVTYVYTNGTVTPFYTRFTVNVKVYSDKDIPVSLYNATEFLNLDPAKYSSSELPSAEDYILMNDIVIENYNPFDTTLIKSLDGNGYTIFIKSFDTSITSSTKNIALFNNVLEDTTLKNVRVNLYNGGQIDLDISGFGTGSGTINIAGFAINNSGVITNCEVVSYYSDDFVAGELGDILVPACVQHNNNAGINITLRNGAGTEPININSTSRIIPTVAGFVINNSGSITNSRVGGDSVIVAGETIYTTMNGEQVPSGYVSAEEIELGIFYIEGQGNISGFVDTNSGAISSSFAKNIDITNESANFITSGFVNRTTSNSQIIGSYVEGLESPDMDYSNAANVAAGNFAREGSSLKSKTGVITGFVNENDGVISDSYSNILIANEDTTQGVYLASGFVYINNSLIENCYSASQIQNLKFNQINFSGVDENGNLLANGTYINCYYYDKSMYEGDSSSSNTTESLYNTGVVIITNPLDTTVYYGFSLADSEKDGIWRMDATRGITLIEANTISYSNRYVVEVDEDYEGATGSNAHVNGLYILMYSTLQLEGSGRTINTSLGGENNPILIADENDFAEVFGNSTSTNVQQYYNNSYIWGTYRLVNDIDLRDVVSDNSRVLPSTTRAFAGILYGNGFEISNISITADDNRYLSYGLFASIEPRNNTLPIVTNLTLNVSQVDAGNSILVGGLSGYIKNSYIINVSINMSAGSGNISGANFAGALTGLAIGNNVFKRIEITNPTVYAIKYNALGISDYMTTSKLYEFRNDVENNLSITTPVNSTFARRLESYSYAGSAIGYVDNYSSQATGFNANSEVYSVDNVKVSGIVNVRGEVAGGVFGLTGYQTNINDVGIEITAPMANNQSHIIAMKYFAGGVVGQSFAKLTRVYAEYDSTTQYNIESNIGRYYQGNMTVERGATNIFYLPTSEYGYTQKYVGGLVGYAESGLIEIAYSKLNVVAVNAEYVGGIVGGLELDDSKVAYRYSTAKVAGSLYSTFVFNEVYATGDVRAQEEEVKTTPNAGGIVGVIKGKSKNVAFLSVNPLNYISSTNYSTGEEYLVNSTNASNIIGVNLLVGSVYASTELSSTSSTWVEENITKSNYTDYFTIYQVLPNQEGVSDDSTASSNLTAETSVAVYESYFFNGQKRFFNLFGNFEADIEENQESELFYAIVSPYAYSSIVAGRSYTQEAFLRSGLWFSTNWDHDSLDQLFPTIRYQTTTSLIYLDAYQESIENAQNIMENNPNVTIVVRGYPTKESTEADIVDIDLREYVGSGKYYIPENFTGTLVRYTSKTSLIIDAPLANALQPGVSLINLSISFIPNSTSSGDGQVEVSAQGLVANSITEATISNLTLNIGTANGIMLNGTTDADSNFGLIAGEIASTSLDGITIHNGATYLDGTPDATGISSGTALLAVEESSDINVGLIAGSFVQNSTVRITTVDGIKFDGFPTSDNGSNFNLLSVTSGGAINVGGYFGQVTKGNGALDLRINIYDINNNHYSSPTSTPNSPYVSINVTGGSGSKINLGGYFGSASGLDRLGVHNDEQIRGLNITLFANSSNNSISSINAGILAGSLTSSSMNSTNMQGSDIYGHLKIASGVTVNTLNAGGLIGSMTASANLSYSNANSVNFEVVASSISGDYSILSDLNRNNFTRNKVGVYSYGTVTSRVNVGDANVGGLVGYLEGSAFTVNGLSVNNQAMNISDQRDGTRDISNGYSFRLNATGSVNTGSIAGYVGSSSTLRISGTVQTATYFDVFSTNTSDNSTNIGGAVGNVDNATSVAIGDNSNGYLYSGAAFVSAKHINYGGTVGYSNNSSLSVTRNLTAGVLKVYGSNSEGGTVNAGGFIGNINAGSTTLSGNVAIGDVFIEYDDSSMQNEVPPTSLQTLSSYYFGGLIGVINTDTNGNATITAQNNATLFSNHNARYNDNKGTAGALFGSSYTNKADSNAAINGNYYSHGVNLTSEDQTAYGTDLGYSEAYTNNGGYESTRGGNILTSGTGSIYDNNISSSVMRSWLDAYKNNNAGSKLNPIEVDSETLTQGTTKFNGMTYYYLDRNTQFTKSLEVGTSTLTNIAIIGNGMVYTGSGYTATLIDSLEGFSYVSSMSVDVDIDLNSSGGGLVNEMHDNSMVYAVQVRGTLEATGTSSISIGGIVGTMYSGKIYDSSTNLTLVYRAGNDKNVINAKVTDNANVYGITDTNDTLAEGKTSQITDKYIINTYATGKIQTMIDTNIYAFANTTDKTLIDSTYTITKIDWNDYTTASKMTIADSNGTILAYGGSGTISNSYYDLNALNLKGDTNLNNDINEGDMGAVSYDGNLKTRNEKAEKGSSETLFKLTAGLSSEFTSDIWFNSGYPTLKYGFMKISSLATADKSKFVNSSSLSGDDKDTYVEETTYTRLANNTKPTASNVATSTFDYYYLIPDYNVLTYISEIKGINLDTDSKTTVHINNFALTNDIDISRTTNNGITLVDENSIIGSFNSGIFDGQSYTIDNLTKSLFNVIGYTDDELTLIKNLRLTNATTSYAGILSATQIRKSTISNITLSGAVTGLYYNKHDSADENSNNLYITIGTLAPRADDSYIFAVTNMATVTTKGSENGNIATDDAEDGLKTYYGISIGGLIGTSIRNNVVFASNYGNINVTSVTELTEGTNKSINVGGIIGTAITSGVISYSYNAASVLNNYAVANTDSLSGNTGYFYTGGIAGYSYPTGKNTITYNYTYNSGIVKSGNKSNGVTTFKDKEGKELETPTINGKSYAGGIVGYSTTSQVENSNIKINTIVNNSYNYGTVEALGKNGEYGFKYVDDNGTLKFAMYQKSIRNVYAYAIGYNVSTSNAGALGTFKIYTGSQAEGKYLNYVPDSVFANGASSEKDDWLYTEDYSEMAGSVTQAFEKETEELTNSYTQWDGYGLNWSEDFFGSFDAAVTALNKPTTVSAVKSQYKFALNKIDPQKDQEAAVTILAYNSYGLPTSFSVKMDFEITLGYKSTGAKTSEVSIASFLGPTVWFAVAAEIALAVGFHAFPATIPVSWLMVGGIVATIGTSVGLAVANTVKMNNIVEEILATALSDTYNEDKLQGYDYYSFKLSASDLSFYYDQQLYNDGSQDIAVDEDNLLNSDKNNATEDIRNTVNQATSSDTTMNTSIDINGTTYSIANNENISSLLQAGVAMGSGTLTTSTLPYINNIGVYDITIESTSGSYSNVNATITSISRNADGSVTFNYNYYTVADEKGNAITGKYNVTITCDYSQNYSFTTDKFSYVYLNDREFGIKLKDIFITDENKEQAGVLDFNLNNLLFEDDTIYYEDDGNRKTYDQVVMLTKLDENNAWLDETIYLAYQNNMLIYIPNAHLGSGRAVNKLTTMNEDDQEIDVNVIDENTYSLFTNLFSNTNYGMYIATGETTTETLSFNQGGSNSYQFTSDDLPGSESENIELSYGASEDLNSSSTSSIENDSVSFIVKPTLSSTESVTNDIEFNGSEIATYDNVDSVWQVSPNTISYTYDGQEYEISLSAIDGGIQMSIANLNAIDDDTLNALIIDIQSKTTSQTSTIGQITSNKDVTLTYEYTLNPVGDFDSVGVYNNIAVLAYDYDASGSTWVIDESAIKSLEIFKNTGLSVQLAGNKLTFSVTGDSSTIDNTKTTIENFMSSIDMYYEDFTNTKTYEKGTDITSKTIISTKDNDDDFSVQYTVQSYLDGISEPDDKRLSITGDSTIIVSLNEDNIDISDDDYTLNGINVRVGSVKANISKQLQWKLTRTDSVKGETAPSGSGYIEITGENDKKIIHSIQSLNQGFSDDMPIIIKAGYNIVTGIFSEQSISNSDVGEYNFVLKVDSSLGVVDNKLYVKMTTNRNLNDNRIDGVELEFYANHKLNGNGINNNITIKYVMTVEEESYELHMYYMSENMTSAYISTLYKSLNNTTTTNLNEIGALVRLVKNDDGTFSYYEPTEGEESGYFVASIKEDNNLIYYSTLVMMEGSETDFDINQCETSSTTEGPQYGTINDANSGIIMDVDSIYEIDGEMYYFNQYPTGDYNYALDDVSIGSDFEQISIEGPSIMQGTDDANESTISISRELIDEIELIISNLYISSDANLKPDYSIAIINDSEIKLNGKYTITNDWFTLNYCSDDLSIETLTEWVATSKVVNEYKKATVTYPEYQPHQIATGISDIGKFTVTKVDYVISQIDDNGNINIYLPSSIAPASTTITISVNPDNDSEICEITATEATTEETLDLDQENPISTGTMESTKPTVAAPIILVNDIVLNDITVTSHSPNVSIIGNDYYISYSGRTLFADSSADNQTYIKDLVILVENTLDDEYRGAIYSTFGKDANNIDINDGIVIKNLKMFGSLSSYNNENPALIAANGTFDDIESFVNIDARFDLSVSGEVVNHTQKTLSLFGNSKNIVNSDNTINTDVAITNYGLIVVPNGIDGVNGEHGNDTNVSGTDGKTGEDGTSIQAFSNANANNSKIMSNSGILRVGDGGNAGAGGSTYYVLGTDGIAASNGDGIADAKDSAEFSENDASIGKAATKESVSINNDGEEVKTTVAGVGAEGTISGFKDGSESISYAGSTALNGVQGRRPFYEILFQKTSLVNKNEPDSSKDYHFIIIDGKGNRALTFDWKDENKDNFVSYNEETGGGINTLSVKQKELLAYLFGFGYNSNDGFYYSGETGSPIVPTDEDGNVKVADNDKYN